MATLSTTCRSKSGTMTLPYWASFAAGSPPIIKSANLCGCYIDTTLVAGASPGESPNIGGKTGTGFNTGFPGFVFTWTATFTCVEQSNGTIRVTITAFNVTGPGYGSMTGWVMKTNYGPSGTNFTFSALGQFVDVPYVNDLLIFEIQASFSSSASGGPPSADFFLAYHMIVGGFYGFRVPYTLLGLLFLRCNTVGSFIRNDMLGQASYDSTANCASTFAGPPVYATGLSPFRMVEYLTLASGMTAATTYNVRWTWEYRTIGSVGAWTTHPTTQALTFVASQSEEVLPWVAANQSVMQGALGIVSEFRLQSAVFF